MFALISTMFALISTPTRAIPSAAIEVFPAATTADCIVAGKS